MSQSKRSPGTKVRKEYESIGFNLAGVYDPRSLEMNEKSGEKSQQSIFSDVLQKGRAIKENGIFFYKALLIGINYRGTKYELNGCANDVKNIRKYLLEHAGYVDAPHSMVVMTEENPKCLPTHKNMLAAINWLVSHNRPGDHLFLHYSGHGGQVKDTTGDRPNGLDNTICPMDFETAGQIDSDHLHDMIVKNLPQNVRLTVLMDCCHSGSILELPFTYRPDDDGQLKPTELLSHGKDIIERATHLIQGGFSASKVRDAQELFSEVKNLYHMFTHRSNTDEAGFRAEGFVVSAEDRKAPKDVYLFAGCKDEQTSADTKLEGFGATGAMSAAFISTMVQARNQHSYESFLAELRKFMKRGFSQVPQLSCGLEINPQMQVTF